MPTVAAAAASVGKYVVFVVVVVVWLVVVVLVVVLVVVERAKRLFFPIRKVTEPYWTCEKTLARQNRIRTHDGVGAVSRPVASTKQRYMWPLRW